MKGKYVLKVLYCDDTSLETTLNAILDDGDNIRMVMPNHDLTEYVIVYFHGEFE